MAGFKNENAEKLRLSYKYRSLITRRKVRIPVSGAKRLVGPDCAYHLYSGLKSVNDPEKD